MCLVLGAFRIQQGRPSYKPPYVTVRDPTQLISRNSNRFFDLDFVELYNVQLLYSCRVGTQH
jgi:hypothetical protein